MHSILEHIYSETIQILQTWVREVIEWQKWSSRRVFLIWRIWGSEVVLSYPGLYAGQTDLVGVYQGRESIIDFKQSNKPKREEWIEDYYYQGVAYATAHDCIHGTKIEQCVIMMCTPDLFYQQFVLNGSRFRQYKWLWLARLSEYYKKKM